MRLSYPIAVVVIFVLAAGLCLLGAGYAVTSIEDNSERSVRRALSQEGFEWAEVEADGLRVILTGIAPDEATRFSAITVAGTEVDASRVIDEMDVEPTADLEPPRFSAEILRNDSGISIIGLIPSNTDRDDLVQSLKDLDPSARVADLMDTADYPAPSGWDVAITYAIQALSQLPRAKVSASAGLVKITAIADSPEDKTRLEQELTRTAPPSLRLGLSISAPRPVITPFTLRFLIDDSGSRFDACSAQDEAARDRIIAAAQRAGVTGRVTCTIGLGVPSPNWAKAAEQSIAALAELGQGSITISDADITLVARQGTEHTVFDRVVGELENSLPEVFSLHAVLPEPEVAEDAGTPEFTATLSPEGLVQIRGRVGDETLREMADSYARAAFGSDSVYMATRVAPDLPADWPIRVLASLEALSYLHNGAVTVSPDTVVLSGTSHREDAKAEIARLLSARLGDAKDFTLLITYEAPPEPVDAKPDPEVCEARIAEVQDRNKITFEPGSATVSAESLDALNQIADILRECGQIRLEIQGHTDSQGREEMNKQLSQSRAQSILNELRARRVLTSSFAAVGYGESQPIADNDTEEGREANRRIEFHLIRPEPVETGETGLEAMEQSDTANEQDGTAEQTDNAPESGTEDQ